MNVLLASNNHTVLEFDRLGRFPSLSLSSIAANLDRDICDVKVADLVITNRNPRRLFKGLLKKYRPDILGLSCMVFQYEKTLELAKMAKNYNKNIIVVIGGYGPTVICEEILKSNDMDFIDFIIRGEGETAFNELVKAIKFKNDLKNVPGLSYCSNGSIIHNPPGDLIDLDTLKIPERNARIFKKGFHTFGYPVDVIETSRGCVMNCNFCTIREMYGKKFRKYKIERIIDDIKDAKNHGAKAIFIVDDNITLDGKRYIDICNAIIEAGLNDLQYGVQVSVKGLKQTPGLIKKMAEAGTRVIYLGIENMNEEALKFMHKGDEFKNSDAYEVVKEIKNYNMTTIAGIISGYPEDTEESIWANFEYCLRIGIDNPIWYILTPFPKTKIRDELLEQGFITNISDYTKYTGLIANIKTKTLSSQELQELRELLGFRYFTQKGTVKYMLQEEPAFAVKLILNQLFTEPKQFVNYTKELFRITNYLS